LARGHPEVTVLFDDAQVDAATVVDRLTVADNPFTPAEPWRSM
jgi:hypothetical protein